MRQPQSIKPCWAILLISFFISSVTAHTVIVYPGWRGNNLHTNGTINEADGLGVAIGNASSSLVYPYGMQWAYPCGGMPMSQNRTKWPIRGGAVSFQPGWFAGHQTALLYINLGIGNSPLNMSLPMVSPFQINGPTAKEYPGTFCLPQIPLPKGLTVNVGDNATIQVVETAVHGAALYNCVDITFAEPEDVAEVTRENCFNSSQITSKLIYSMDPDSGASSILSSSQTTLAIIPLLLAGYLGLLF
ncbi:hypothetical protein FQN52_006145 [Onygenales sp. PD_12]|nr:hypothetical protein FQN52_006145 [Onygenales sp. PD_12]